MEICAFHDGSSFVDFVAKQSDYNNKAHFLSSCFNEFESILEDYFSEKEWNQMALFTDTTIVKDDLYCRFYPNMPEDSGPDIESGYTYCQEGRGAFLVYSVSIEELVEGVKNLALNSAR